MLLIPFITYTKHTEVEHTRNEFSFIIILLFTLNLFLILANSLLILLTSASLLLQFRISDIKTANPEKKNK